MQDALKQASATPIASLCLARLMFEMLCRAAEKTVQGVPKCIYLTCRFRISRLI